MSIKQTPMLSFFENGSTPSEKSGVVDEGPAATKKRTALSNDDSEAPCPLCL